MNFWKIPRRCIGVVHGISLVEKLRVDHYEPDRVSLLNNHFDKILYSDKTWGEFLHYSGVQNLEFFPAVRYSGFFIQKLASAVSGTVSIADLGINTQKEIILYIDGTVRDVRCKKQLINQFNDLLNSEEYFIIFKIKPRDYESIIHEIDKSKNIKVISSEFSVEELLTVCDFVILLSGAIVTAIGLEFHS